MKIIVRSLLAVGVVTLLGLFPGSAILGQAGPTPGLDQPNQQPLPGQEQQPRLEQQPGLEQPGEEQQPGQEPQEQELELTLEGEISSVNVEEMTITLIGEDGMESQFSYDAQTEVVRQPEGVQGLTGETGTWARVSYHPVEDTAVAHRIELVERGESDTEGQFESDGLESPDEGLDRPDDELPPPNDGLDVPNDPGVGPQP